MSWLIDTKAISSLLKEAQKQIDKALDIKDDEDGGGGGAGESTSSPTRSDTAASSESLEVLTPSEILSPSSSSDSRTMYESDSVEVISAFDTSKGISQINSLMTSPMSPESIEVLGMGSAQATDVESPDTEPVTVRPITTAPSRSGLRLPIPSTLEEETTSKMNESNESDRTIITDSSMEIFEIRTVSDSTTSFEEILPSIRPTYQSSIPHEVSDEKPRKCSSGESDEAETGTSSDIEIISSPSTATSACRESPQKVEDKKGHFREPSEVSIQSTASEDSHYSNQSETEKLRKRINELSEILEQREGKLLELGRRNSELHDKNSELERKLEARAREPLEISNVTEEYAQRMSALEKKFQQTIREKDAFRKELGAMKQEFVGKISKVEVEKSLAEKEDMIAELRGEGEKLSKQILNYTNIIKKLRAKEKENDVLTKSQRTQIEELTEETDRLKKSLTAKEDVERSQIEAVHKLSSERKKLDDESLTLRSQLDDLTQRFETVKASLDAAKQELKVTQQDKEEISRKLADTTDLEAQHSEAASQNAQMSEVISELKRKWAQSEDRQAAALDQLRHENTNLLRQLEEADHRLQEQNEAYSSATVPLMKQIETLRTQMQGKTASYEKREQELVVKLEEAQDQVRQLTGSEKTFKERITALKSQTLTLERKLSETQQNVDELSVKVQTQKFEFDKESSALKKDQEKSRLEIEEYKTKLRSLEAKLNEAEEKLKQHEEDDRTYTEPVKRTSSHGGSDKRCSSPTLSMDRLSEMGESFTWQPDDLDTVSQSGQTMMGYGSSLLHTTSLLENLQATIKQKDGEISQLQWEVNQLHNERKILAEEVSNLSVQLENLKENIRSTDETEKQFGELQTQYNALLTMYGEKIEETDELKLDLIEVKEMYKAQIEELLQK